MNDTAAVPRSALSHLACSWCGATCDADVPQNLCPACQHPLLAVYDLAAVPPASVWRQALGTRPWTMWRYTEVLPLRQPDRCVSLGETVTPLLALPRTAHRL